MGQGNQRQRAAATGVRPALQPAAPSSLPTRNLRSLAGWRPVGMIALAASASGGLLTAAFPPLEWDWVAWVALLPVLLAPVPSTPCRRLAAGALLGLVHYTTNLLWLNEIGFCAGILLGLYCALYPALWYVSLAELSIVFGGPDWRRSDVCGSGPAGDRPAGCGWGRAVGRSGGCGWLFTGFPWNELGISQWQRPLLLSLTCYTGVSGVSFLIVCANLALSQTALAWWHGVHRGGPWRQGRAPALTLGALIVVAVATALQAPRVPPAQGVLRVVAVQGNIPQCRFWTEAQFQEALEVYTELTRQAVADRP